MTGARPTTIAMLSTEGQKITATTPTASIPPNPSFALRATVGYIGESWIPTSPPYEESSTLVWYKSLLPPNQASLFEHPVIGPPFEIDSQQRGVRFSTRLTSNRDAVVSWLVDTRGFMVGDSVVTGEMYYLNDPAPEPGVFYLGDLPPIISTNK